MKRTLFCLLPAALCLLAAGCVENVWLPDSSGFVCITRDHTLVHYDLAKKTERVIARHDWLHRFDYAPERPAVSPDSKRVALVRHVSSKDAEAVQFLIYDLASAKELEKTPEIALPGHVEYSPVPLVGSGMAFWSPDGRRLLFEVSAPLFRDGKPVDFRDGDPQHAPITTLGFYDLDTKKHRLFTGLAIDEELAALGVSPFSPDGRGFLAGRLPTERDKPDAATESADPWTGMVFVDWNGREHSFKVAPQATEAAERGRRERERTPASTQVIPRCRWEKNTCVIPFERGLLHIDTQKFTITYEANADSARQVEYAKKNKADVLGWKDDLLVLFREAPDAAAPPANHDAGVDRPTPDRPIDVEMLMGMDLATGKAAKKVKVVRADAIDNAVLSPNGQYLFLRAVADGPEGSRIRRVVIDAKGKVVLDAAEKTAVKRASVEDAPPAPPPAPPPPKPGAPAPPEA